jgi:hypothetical protein
LLQPVMHAGELVESLPPLEQIRLYAKDQLDRLPESLRVLKNAPAYPALVSDGLQALTGRMDKANASR